MDPFDFKPLDEDGQEEILEYIKSRIDEADPDELRRAMLSMGWVEGREELVQPLLLLVREGKPKLALAALEGLSQLGVPDCEKPLARYIVDLFKKESPSRREVRYECIRVLGKVGTKHCVGFLAELIRNPAPATPEDKEAAVEALVSLAENRVPGIAKILNELLKQASGVVKETITCALKELNLRKWEERGYFTIEADFSPEDDSFPG